MNQDRVERLKWVRQTYERWRRDYPVFWEKCYGDSWFALIDAMIETAERQQTSVNST